MPIRISPKELLGGAVTPGRQREQPAARLGLNDACVYDNLGLEPVWKDREVVLVSHGGATFQFDIGRGPIGKLSSYRGILLSSTTRPQRSALISNVINETMTGTYWGICSATGRYGPSAPRAYSQRLAAGVIARVRTDPDAFSEGEIRVLENHGFLLAEAAVQCHIPILTMPNSLALRVPHPDLMDETLAGRTLRDSHKLSIIGRR